MSNVTVGFQNKIVMVFTTQEDWVLDFEFYDKNGAPIPQTGATFSIDFTPLTPGLADPATVTPAVQAAPNAHRVSAVIPKATSSGYSVGAWSADLIKTAGGRTRRYVPAVVRQVIPGSIL